MNAKQRAFEAWNKSLPALRHYRKLKDYGLNETPETIWSKLPQDSKDYWNGFVS